jgi:transposase-like protein
VGYLQENKLMRFRQVEQLLASNLTVAEWCKLNKVGTTTIYKWLKVYREENLDPSYDSSKWIEVTRQEKHTASALAVLPNNQETAAIANSGTSTEKIDAVACATHIDNTPTPSPEITVDIKGIEVKIPKGCDSKHIKSVLSVVAGL